jgi:asparagine synthase (glutamine-hydrolysing)
MCGIVGVLGSKSAERVQEMLPLLEHRGPDGHGCWSNMTNFSLGHTRLAINDLSPAGTQPMISKDGRCVIAVNGEIYNYQILRKELENKGRTFQSNSDSEVVIHAWQEWGEGAFVRFNGMFAIALYDIPKQRLLLVRDRLGIKPLYYTQHNKELIFASEIKALRHDFSYSQNDIDFTGLAQYLTYQNYFTDSTLHKHIKLLQPGTILSFDSDNRFDVKPFWQLSLCPEKPSLSFEGAVDKFKSTFKASVSRHMLSDVPVASYLSAGFDSASVATSAAQQDTPPVCFTGHFHEGGWYDEASIAAEIANRNASEHHPILIKPEDLPRVLDKLIIALDEPRMGIGAFSQYCVAEQVAKTHKVVLTGHGGDELFSGYPIFKLMHMLEKIKKEPSRFFHVLANVRKAEIPHFFYFLTAQLGSRARKQFLPVLHSRSLLNNALKPEWSAFIQNISPYEDLLKLSNGSQSKIDVLYYHYMKTYLHGLLIVEDKISMAHSIESRTPMLDNEMLDLSVSLSQNNKLYNGNLKAIIKEAAREYLPKSIFTLPKRGFPTPLSHWLRGPLKSWFRSKLLDSGSGLMILFSEKWLHNMCISYLNSPRQMIRPLDEIQTHRMWQLLCLESFLRNQM